MGDDSDDAKPRKPIGYKSPPIEHQIKKGERRNPNGRRGKDRSAPNEKEDLSLASIIREEMTRRVPQKDGTEIEMHRRVIQAAALKAANGNLTAARMMISELRRLEEREARAQNELVRLAWQYRYEGLEIFADQKRRRLEPPDIVPHPSHVVIEGDVVSINGPIDHEGQVVWERIKRLVVVQTENLALAREHARQYPGEEWAEKSLQSTLRLRRKAMRLVPKGWNWREDIWNRASVADDRARKRLIRQITEERQGHEQDQA